MIKRKLDSIKNSLVKVDEKNNKKNIENLVLLAILLIIVVIAMNYIWKGGKKNNTNNSNKILAGENKIEGGTSITSENLEEKLENILSSISGVGEVKVLITYSQTSQINPVYNENYDESVTEEEDTNGGKRTVSSSSNKKEVVSANNEIITKSMTSPQIQGAVVIAKGAGNATVKTNIIQAVEAATGLSTYKIQVFEMN